MKPPGRARPTGSVRSCTRSRSSGVVSEAPRYGQDREVDGDSGAGELLQIGRLRHTHTLARIGVLIFSDTRMLKGVRHDEHEPRRNARRTPEGQRRDEELDALWDQLEEDLTAYLATMIDPDEGDHLLLELADPDPDGEAGCPPYAQFAGFGDGRMIRAEISGNAYLLPQYRLDEDGVRTLRADGLVGQRRRRAELVRRARRSTGADEIADARRLGAAPPLRRRPPAAADLPGVGAGR